MALKQSRRSDGAMWIILLLGTFLCMMQTGVSSEDAGEEAAEAEAEVQSKLAVIEMKVSNLYPEGFDWDPRHKRFVVGSTTQGKLVTVTEAGVVEDFIKEDEYPGASILGVTVDSIYDRVLAVVHRTAHPPLDGLAAYDLRSKKRIFFVNFLQGDDLENSNAKVVANDVAVDHDGNAYVTNSGANSIWKVTLKGKVSVFVESIPQLPVKVEPEFVKLVTSNGIVHHDGYLLVSQTNSGALFRVRIYNKEVQAVKVKDDVVMPGADGMALRSDGTLVVVSTHTAWLLSTRDTWRTAVLLDEIPLDPQDFTTSAAAVDRRVFTIHNYFFDRIKGVERDTFNILEIGFPKDKDNPWWLVLAVGIVVFLLLAWKMQMNHFNKEYTKKRL